MKAFAELADGLAFQPSHNGKLRLLERYFATVPDPDRGFALAALTGGLTLPKAQPKMLRELVQERVDPVLFDLSHDFVGDLAETISLIWPSSGGRAATIGLGVVAGRLGEVGRAGLPGLLVGWLDEMDSGQRWALLKLITGGPRVGVTAGLAREALARFGGVSITEIEGLWHGIAPPYEALFAWLEGRGDRPDVSDYPVFRSFMLANTLDEGPLEGLDPATFRAEWQWDGLRVQLVAHANGQGRLYARNGDDISGAFPDIQEAMNFCGVLDGTLLVNRDGQIAPFDQLQKRLSRKRASTALRSDLPAHIRLHDMLWDGEEDLRPLPFDQRRARLESWFGQQARPRLDLSPMVEFADWAALAALRQGAGQPGVAGMMLKRGDSPYVCGRPQGSWFNWKRDALQITAVLMYAQRGQGKYAAVHADTTFGCWRHENGEAVLVPVGKARFDGDEADLAALDQWVRKNTTNRFGPVREVSPGLVLDIACDAVQASRRHKSGLTLRGARINRICWDKASEDADPVEKLGPQ